MGWLDKNVTKEEFDAYKEQASEQFKLLQDLINKKASEDAEEAREAAKSASIALRDIREIQDSVETALDQLESYRDQAREHLTTLSESISESDSRNNELTKEIEANKVLSEELENAKDNLTELLSEITETHKSIQKALDDASDLPELVEETVANAEKSKTTADHINSLLSHSMKKKAEIDELHKLIIGYEIDDGEGKKERIDGLKDELENSYKLVSSQIISLSSKIEETTNKITESHNEKIHQESEKFDALISKSHDRFTEVSDQLKTLLPGAMAAGLSAAYEEKKVAEEAALKTHEGVFRWAIVGLATISLIPLAVDVYLLNWRGADLIQVLQDTPNIILSILPLYFPVLWLAHSTNKKLNLSKRLIEEYTHKSVLGKTFSGLSNQIETLPHENEVKAELRTRLLFNVLQVSAENPGKLITNYQKSDHPLMEALENSAKLADSVDALSKIPGFSSIAKKLAEKSEDILSSQKKKVDDGLSTQDALEEKESGNETSASNLKSA